MKLTVPILLLTLTLPLTAQTSLQNLETLFASHPFRYAAVAPLPGGNPTLATVSAHWCSSYIGKLTGPLHSSPYCFKNKYHLSYYYPQGEYLQDSFLGVYPLAEWNAPVLTLRFYENDTDKYQGRQDYTFDGAGRVTKVVQYHSDDMTRIYKSHITWDEENLQVYLERWEEDEISSYERNIWNKEGYLLAQQNIYEEKAREDSLFRAMKGDLTTCEIVNRYDKENILRESLGYDDGILRHTDLYTYRETAGILNSYKIRREGDVFKIMEEVSYDMRPPEEKSAPPVLSTKAKKPTWLTRILRALSRSS